MNDRLDLQISQVIARASDQLRSISDSPQLDSQLLMGALLGQSREWLYAHSDEPLSDDNHLAFLALLERRLSGEPLAYITGHREFWGDSFRVSPDTLIPRPETELLIECLLAARDSSPILVADLGTGSGAITATLARERPAWHLVGVDMSLPAIRVARCNSQGLGNVSWVHSSWCRAIRPGSLDVIVSNPPYIREDDPHLHSLGFEPRSALSAGPDGLDAIRVIIKEGYDCLVRGGLLLMEHGYDQRQQVCDLLTQQGYQNIQCLDDLAGQPRAIMASR